MKTGMLGRIFTVARREYVHHARSKGFWLTMVVVPVIYSYLVRERRPAALVQGGSALPPLVVADRD